ncbi:methylated-DNA--[protein]-cysteine S-methyltransferase [Aquabacterium sp. J223]|uniref:methylated-DNA--[protein]-cysteine S-methyltransferase n=1 Tax=Aquabacterium sp. J223 TaxID=2898431 RepID=UPI0021AD636C|nr:methylated-DNA--[protein]-cysteine S-methyltransferase [Aquabacterium sp. J223]UUX97157.1 methylated-DNA--[protein]-cysteine S-methyltransferase [Aquabacterium sp. J223]
MTASLNTHLIAWCQVDTPLGPMTLAAARHGLAGAWFDGQRHHPGPLRAPEVPDHPLLVEAARQITDHFAGRRRRFELPLDLHGTAFQQSVWQALLALPCGATAGYGAIARAIGRPSAVRAVGAAVGRNPVSIVVPCHRVLGHDGGLTGYAGGLDRKQALLLLEGVGAALPPAHRRALAPA